MHPHILIAVKLLCRVCEFLSAVLGPLQIDQSSIEGRDYEGILVRAECAFFDGEGRKHVNLAVVY